MKSGLQGMLGSAIYQIWSNYDEIAKYPPEEISVERLNQINEKLISVSAYSYLVDQKEGTNLMVPLANDLRAITEYLNKQLHLNPSPTPDDQEVYRYMLEVISEILPQIGSVYYIPDQIEGPTVALKPNRTAVKKMVVSRDRLKAYASQLKSKTAAAA
ncbi:hypothetical protein [Paenibacillus sp. MMO-58]|uniref:hypothetical protein n=1 Tax=Paenibacillus sp. MMO-58 TaxID=3081290 RepID=UPI003018EBC6